jgi:hypothetical protein
VLKLVRDLKLDRIQLGGDETVGWGIVKRKQGESLPSGYEAGEFEVVEIETVA